MIGTNENNTAVDERPLVMVVEDSEAQAAYLTYILSLNEYRVLRTRSALTALQWFQKGLIPNVLITDIKLPQMTGFELMEKLRHLQIEVPTIVISELQKETDFEKAFVLGAEDYFVKPYSPLDLLARIQKVLMSKIAC